jgi:hypothetical protein
MIIEILSLVLILVLAGAVWLMKGGSVKGFIIFILIFLIGGLGLAIGTDHFNRWKDSREEKTHQDMRDRLNKIKNNLSEEGFQSDILKS